MKKIFVNGTFDVVHYGHINLLRYAKSLGDYLLVAIDSDARVRELKGDSRPINRVYERLSLIRNLKFVDDVLVFGSSAELDDIISIYKADIVVRGSDHNSSVVPHGKVVFYDRLQNYSSSGIIEKILGRNHEKI